MYQKRIILFFCMIFVANATFCQLSLNKVPGNSLKYTGSFTDNRNIFKNILPGNFYVSQLGFFCKKEWKFESATKIPLRIRIGTLQYCDWLEGKKNATLTTGLQ